MFFIHFILLSVSSWIYVVDGMEVIPERAEITYMNPKYMYTNATINVRRYSRRSNYYINLMGTSKTTFMDNVTVGLSISQLLHNEYRSSFVRMSHKLCDLINNEPFVGGAVKKSGVVCPLPTGFHNIANLTAQTQNFPNVFPFEKGCIEFIVSVTDTKEPILKLNIYALFKQKL